MDAMMFKGLRWYRYQGVLIPDAAPHENVTLSEEEATELLQSSGAPLLRWSSDWDVSEPTEFWYIIKDVPESLDAYKSKVRNQIRKGLEQCTVAQVDAAVVAAECYDVYRRAFERYDTFSAPLDASAFRRSILEPGEGAHEFWVVRSKASGAAVGYAWNVVGDGICRYSTMKFDPQQLKSYGSYALIHTMNRHYLRERGLKYVSDGARSISHATDIQGFLERKFGFRRAYCRLHVAYRRDVAVAVTLLFPLRALIARLPGRICRRITVLLRQEAIRRACAV